MRAYLHLLRHRPLGPLLAAAALGRLPQTMNGLGLVFFAHEATGSFAVAGAAVGGSALGMSLGGPLLGRAADAHGAWVVRASSVAYAALMAAIVLTGHGGPPAVLVILATFAGVAYPPIAGLLRGRLPQLTEDLPHLLGSAYALDSVLVEMTFIGGPLLAGLLVGVASPSAILVAAAVAGVVGPLAFLHLLPDARPDAPRPTDRLGPLRSPAIATVVMSMLPFGMAMGAIEVMLPAFSVSRHAAGLGGVLLAIWSVGSVLGGLAYGARTRSTPVVVLHRRLTLLYPLAYVPLLASSSVASMAFLVLPAGLLVSPLFASRNELVGSHAPPGTETEALSWPMATLLAGISLGSALSGALIQRSGWRASVLLAIAAAAMAAAVVALRRRSLASATPDEEPAGA
jgi:MFS family permease